MPETTKITIETPGEPTVVLTIDVRDPPVSLGTLLERARASRARGGARHPVVTEHFDAFGRPGDPIPRRWRSIIGKEDVFAGIPPESAPKTAETTSTRPTGEQVVAKLQRIAAAKTDGVFTGEDFQPSEARVALEMLESAARGGLTPGSIVFKAPPNLDNDLEDVLDSYRLAGKMAGLQVFAVDHVVAWVGNIERLGDHSRLHIREAQPEPVPYFFTARGANALEDAAKYLRSRLDAERQAFTAAQDASRHG